MTGLPTRIFLLGLLLSFPAQVTEIPLPVSRSVSSLKENCTDENVFWDEDSLRCKTCSVCGPGYGPMGNCGHGVGQRLSCKVCSPGTFSDQSDTAPCRQCQHCEHREIVQQCTSKHDTVCGECLYSFVMLPGTSVCIPCSTLDGHDYSDCPDVTTPRDPTTTAQTPSTTQSHGDLSINPTSEPSNNPDNVPVHGKQADSHNQGHWKTLALSALGIIVVLVIPGVIFAIWYIRKNRNGSHGHITRDPPVGTLELEVIGLPGRTKREVHFAPNVGLKSDGSDAEQYDSPSESEPLLSQSQRSNRPSFMRSFSAPAGDSELQRLQAERDKRRQLHSDCKNKELDRLCEKACLKGKDQKIQDFSFEMKQKIALQFDPKPEDPTHKYWFNFGVLWGINEQMLKNFDKRTMAVFEYIGPRGHTVEELIEKLVEMNHTVLLKAVCEHVIQQGKKPPV